MKNYCEIMQRSRLLLLTLAIAGLLAGCNSKRPDPTSSVSYTLTLDANGGALATGTNATQQVTSGEKAQKPADPTRANYTFLGWTLTKDGANFFNFDTEAITAGLTLYAKWQDNSTPAATYAVTFDANGGALATGTNATQQIASGSRVTPPAAAPTRAMNGQRDFDFVYWSADKRTRFDFNTPVTQATTLYALWSVTLPDTNFRDKLKTIVPLAFEGDRLVAGHADVIGLTLMDVSASNISDLSGIEFFTALNVLACHENQLSALDVRQNTALAVLYCSKNNLASLDMSQNTALTNLGCNDNQLTMLDVRQNTALTELICSNNQLSVLDVSKNTALTVLNCIENQITTLDVTQNTALTELGCNINQLSMLNVTQNTALTRLGCSTNRLTTLDVSKNTALTELYCADNPPLTTLDMRGMRTVSSSSSTPSLGLIGNPNLVSLKVHTNLKDNSIVYGLKANRGNALTIEVYDAAAGSAAYSSVCSNYQPGNGATGTCTP